MPIRLGDGTGLSVPGFAEVRLGDGTVLWSASVDATVLEDFESYDTQAELENAWRFGTSPSAYELQETSAFSGGQNIRSSTANAQARNASIGTTWGNTYSLAVAVTNASGNPGFLVQHQDEEQQLRDCYWIRINNGADALQMYTRVDGATTETLADVAQSFSTGEYRIVAELNSSNEIQASVLNYDDALDATPIVSTGFQSPSTVHSGGHVGTHSGTEADVNHVVFDDVLQHP